MSRVEWANRRGSGQDTAAADAAMAGVIARLEAEIAALDQVIEDAIGQDKDLQTRHDDHQGYLTIAVGNAIAGIPPHRSERAPFGHSAPTSGV